MRASSTEGMLREPRRPVMRAWWAVVALAAALIAAGCASIAPGSPTAPSPERAASLAQQGEHDDAARIYESLAARSSGTIASDYLIAAAGEWLAARRPDEAQRVLGKLGTGLDATQAVDRELLEVDIALAKGNAAEAWRRIAAMPQPSDKALAVQYLEVRQRAAFANGLVIDGIKAEIAREPLLPNADARRAARSQLLTDLGLAVERGAKLNPASERDLTVRGWLELAPIAAAAARSPGSTGPAARDWLARFPNHPARDVVRADLEPRAVARPDQRAAHIALLLPVSGRQANAAAQIRDGFFTAWYSLPLGTRPQVRVYDTAAMSTSEAIGQAAANGATAIVGPLLREEVAAAADHTGTRPPILALNFLGADRAAPAGFFQFALSPEDEARSIARRVVAEGEPRGVALIPNGEWGTRVLAAFTAELQAQGGALAGTATYYPDENDYSTAITDLLQINQSKARARRLEQVLGMKLAFEPRRRSDADFIFAPAPAATARQLRPQLRFHYAGDLPTYSTSDAYEPRATANQDLDGVIFPDMPWVLGDGARTLEVRENLRTAYGEQGMSRSKLFAFGFDAFQLALRLPPATASDAAIDGLTGRLTFEADGRVHRDLLWAQMKNGQPRLLPPPGEAP
jgi:hypothetical protein